MTPLLRRLLLETPFNPYRLSGNAAHYSLDGAASDMTYIIDGSNRLQLVADRSGNSGVNCLVLNGASGNYASSPDSVPLSITGSIDVRAKIAPNSYATGSPQTIIGRRSTPNSAIQWRIGATGKPVFIWSADGTNLLGTEATVALTAAAYQELWVRATLNVNDGAGNRVQEYFTSADGATWTKLGDTITTAGTTSIFDSNLPLEIGGYGSGTNDLFAGRIFRVQIRSGIDGTVVFDADFTRVAKLASSFTESSANGATVTINTSGDTGARICGARDLVQLTQAKQPIVSIAADGRRIATFDGSNDYMKAAPFPLSQPESVYFVGSQVSWTASDGVYDGGGDTTMLLQQRNGSVSPNVALFAGAFLGNNSNWAVGARATVSAVFNGASSSLRVNRLQAVTGSAGSTNANGFLLGSWGNLLNFGNVAFSEVVLRSAADNDALQLKIAGALMRKWGVS